MGPPASSTNKTDYCHIIEILLKLASNKQASSRDKDIDIIHCYINIGY
jgi:hypothetical protein